MAMEISVIIPAFNEAKVITQTVGEVKDFLKNNFSNFEIIVIDDDSTDRTLNLIKSISGVKVLHNLKNHGKGYTVKKGLLAAKGELILFMDADNSTAITELSKLLKHADQETLAIGSRALPESEIKIRQSKFKIFLGKTGNLLSRLIVAPGIYDTQCGFKLLPGKMKFIFNKMTINGFGFDYELIFLAKKYNFKVKEVPIVWSNNFNSTVKWHSYPLTLLQLFQIRLYDLLGKY
ncbi:MAG: hypothetical protein COV55_04140 [Candidatus Komeilibacteria bacterium CG11_big_fil_rev_8_21_14_0_20_36_20]|uniref:dolichyl-phosphate beta-glucosyltransferase n=1 Tax=Candidatus Komeilibacteria bacterium CG11_big_fil_rev_8_21_14_0_20_36_20 TaxID=1974477 RepID=A0A2H0NC25_9BACT|nr:MAG: hypothetical protein COV55_04140 [Candidatus Komeilibacteria bacterium CG11_big_fil_rev_8_21_14_0_20_36_20]PIR82022.1 MAG: hypothetical protein COU21_00775 [Candidatus Komeilibacteria bacterium CG10_big_fil_rev_8_21_14_0_10_36_65]PJC55560.1 MAG: hypothetical protein CO027_01780 [Candidatus Komeilibacteria bacterium CG_4_9_14_0_2_um_filter_36_13]